jgi:peptidoglycan hydrolase CwlO-like protein
MKKEKRQLKSKNNNHLIKCGLIFFVAVFFVSFLTINIFSISAAQDPASAKQDLANKINALRSQINQYQDQIDAKSQKEASLGRDIEVLDADIKKIELQIMETNLVISQLDGEVGAKQMEIDSMEKRIKAKQEILTKFLQELYERGDASAAELVFGNKNFSDYFFQSDSLVSFEDQTKDVFDQLVSLKQDLKKQKEAILEKKADKENYRYIQVDQERSLEGEKQMKDILIARTKNEKDALQQETEKLQAELNAIQSLGEPIAMDEAIKSAQYASKLTSVAPEFLLGVLRVESGLGTNVGGGRYKSDMNPNQWDTFKGICKELGVDPDKVPVSRRACYNRDAKDGCGGWGGAMGPAQFMPSTLMGYKSKVEKTTGSPPANPWDIKDSLVAMGLKLAAVDGVAAGDRKAWAKAAGMYLAGGNWENYPWYSDRVLFYADGFKKIMKDKI